MESNQDLNLEFYIGETKQKAGIFLSRRIAEMKKYGKYLKLEKFTEIEAAMEEFFTRYPFIKKEEFLFNRLYEVREPILYEVWWTPQNVIILEDGQGDKWLEYCFPDDWQEAWYKGNLTWEEAQNFAKARFYKYYKEDSLMIVRNLKVGLTVNIDNVK